MQKRCQKRVGVVVIVGILLLLVLFVGGRRLRVHAQNEQRVVLKRYYTSVQIQQGDSLWKYAEEYGKGSGYSKKEYVEELKRMNGLTRDEIHAGRYLTVVYFSEQ